MRVSTDAYLHYGTTSDDKAELKVMAGNIGDVVAHDRSHPDQDYIVKRYNNEFFLFMNEDLIAKTETYENEVSVHIEKSDVTLDGLALFVECVYDTDKRFLVSRL